MKAVWSFAPRTASLYAGVKPAGLFRATIGGQSWQHVAGLQKHPTRPQWRGGGAGLILHSIVRGAADDAEAMWVGMSAVGVFHSGDGGETWEPRNSGTRADFMPEGQRYPVFGQCVHCLVSAPQSAAPLPAEPLRHVSKRRRRARHGRASRRGFLPPSAFRRRCIRAIPKRSTFCRSTATVGPISARRQGRGLAHARRRQELAGARKGLPQENAYFAVLRQAMATDRLDPAGVYFGTNTGSLYASADEGENWSEIAQHLPTILSVETLVVDS